jgi:hypothetical protein
MVDAPAAIQTSGSFVQTQLRCQRRGEQHHQVSGSRINAASARMPPPQECRLRKNAASARKVNAYSTIQSK